MKKNVRYFLEGIKIHISTCDFLLRNSNSIYTHEASNYSFPNKFSFQKMSTKCSSADFLRRHTTKHSCTKSTNFLPVCE